MKLNWRAGDVRGRFNVSAFQTKYKGALQFFNVRPLAIPPTAPDQPTRTSIAINASDATVRGVEAELTIEPTRWLNFSFSGAYVDQKIDDVRSEEHTSELQSLMRTSYAVFCLNKITIKLNITTINPASAPLKSQTNTA